MSGILAFCILTYSAATAHRLLRRIGAAQSAQEKQSGAPQWPAQCNVTYLQSDSYRAFSYYASQNFNCLDDGSTCIQTGNKEKCTYPCTSGATTMAEACAVASDQFCTVTAANPKPLDSAIPPYSIIYDICLPNFMAPGAGCHADASPALVEYFKYDLCGPGLYTSPDCQVSLQCAWDTYVPVDPNVWVWGTLGTIAGVGMLAGGAMVYQRRRLAAMGIEWEDTAYEAADEAEDVSGPPPTTHGPAPPVRGGSIAAAFAYRAHGTEAEADAHEDDPTRDRDHESLLPEGSKQ